MQFVLFAVIVAVVTAAPPNAHLSSSHPDVVVVKESPSTNDGLGAYNFAFEQSDGQARHESAQVVHVVGAETPTLKVSGSYSWVDPVSNQHYVVNYVADELGYRPEGDHLPLLPNA